MKLLSPSRSSSVLPVIPVRAANRPRGFVAAEEPVASKTQGSPKTRRMPAEFYWHPCRESARVPLPAPPMLQGLTAMVREQAAVANTSLGPPAGRPSAMVVPLCRSRSISPTFPKTPEQSCVCAPASVLTRISSGLPDFRPPIAPSAGPGWTISMRLRSSAIRLGGPSRCGGATTAAASCCSQPERRHPISTTAFNPTTCCCSAANRPESRKRFTTPPTPG